MLNSDYAKQRIQSVIPLLTAAFIPLYPMLYLYNQAENARYLSLFQVLAASLVFMIGSIVLYLVSKKIMKSPHAALFYCVIAWVVFFSYGLFRYDTTDNTGIKPVYLLPAYAVAFVVLWCGIWIFSKRFDFKIISFYISILLGVLLFVNGGMTAYYTFSLQKDQDVVYKTEFTVDNTLPMPNVYWFHCDGMLGFDPMERYFGDPQEEFALALESRGFIINRTANFEARVSTITAIPVLMSPYFYDSLLRGQIANGEKINDEQLLLARQKNELIHAFSQKGYQTATIDTLSSYTFPNTDRYYDRTRSESPLLTAAPGTESLISSIDKTSELFTLLRDVSVIGPFLKNRIIYEFLNITTLISWEDIDSQVDVRSVLESDDSIPAHGTLVRCLDDSLEMPEPRFVLTMSLMAHFPYQYDENGRLHNNDTLDIHSYLSNHKYTSKVLINMIDMILEQDPSAVIVLQADHGPHARINSETRSSLSISDEDIHKYIRNGVMSAVRVPEQYGPLEKPLNPLDITRYLINHYVGENYEYLET